MGATYKNNIELTIFGESHGKAIGITIGNLPSGIQIDLGEVSRDMKRRAPGQNKMSTSLRIRSGLISCTSFSPSSPLAAIDIVYFSCNKR